MDGDEETNDGNVAVTVEITGKYDEVVPKLRSPAPEDEALGAVMSDFAILLETVSNLDGGTRSAIADQLPPDMDRTYDAEAVVGAFQILERYELVVLDGNTWKPGPALRR